jgi:mono/diheme cytochrome c family protein
MTSLKIMVLVAFTSLLFVACASGPDAPEPAAKSKNNKPAVAYTPAPPYQPTPIPGTNSGLGYFPSPSPKSASGTTTVNAPGAYTAQGCVKCHGDNGKGIIAGAPDFNDKSWQGKRTDAQLAETIEKGKMPMPGYGSQLTSDQVKGLVAYVRSFGK